MTHQTSCPDCGGKGWIEMKCLRPEEARICAACNGSGLTPLEKQCPACHGKGLIETRTMEQQKCPKCLGGGLYPPPESL